MKMIGALAMVLVLGPAIGRADTQLQSAASRKTINVIVENAQWARENANIYQWMRVNREVDRIQSASHSLRKSADGNADRASALAAVQQSVQELNSARTARSPERISAAVAHLLDGVNHLK